MFFVGEANHRAVSFATDSSLEYVQPKHVAPETINTYQVLFICITVLPRACSSFVYPTKTALLFQKRDRAGSELGRSRRNRIDIVIPYIVQE